ncbi:hypothetical protein AVT69_gp307 [Pseudomonas phage PhiPA3]|uniref:Uncharacterized protein 309 n=1 Tax=Pseudomonas phage PhiPA3 TaxID=998086 RepID=F8SJE5_BPPA3|nr:hypothetical protein AVT69_gp307 [Pseudomonas phage PhiPA3]AEH03732.1 hypothetical protein [Pseudomonas phage PhiPA3]
MFFLTEDTECSINGRTVKVSEGTVVAPEGLIDLDMIPVRFPGHDDSSTHFLPVSSLQWKYEPDQLLLREAVEETTEQIIEGVGIYDNDISFNNALERLAKVRKDLHRDVNNYLPESMQTVVHLLVDESIAAGMNVIAENYELRGDMRYGPDEENAIEVSYETTQSVNDSLWNTIFELEVDKLQEISDEQ